MRVGSWASRKSWIIAGCLVVALQVGFAQKGTPVNSPQSTRAILVEKAHALESRGRPDMAIQLWQQILLSDPRNTDALAGLAKDLKLIGSIDKSYEALERLRKVNPNDPNIPKIEALASTRVESDQLRHAGELARQGKLEDSMRIYRELYGDHPPDGDVALAYYQTLYGTANGKQAAISAMRALAERNPGDPRFVVELGIMLTYDAKTRAEGIRILQAHPKDSNAQTAIRQALIWDAANPTSAAELRQYLHDHPQDAELAGYLKENESKLAQMNSGIARTPAEREAFAALNAHKLGDAEKRFADILAQHPENSRAAAGMGFLRMQQNNFGGAITYLTQAEQNGFKDKIVDEALVTSRFWFTMSEAAQAFNENQLDVAAAKYRAALVMRPHSQEALNGLAGLLTKEEQYEAASEIYEQLLKVQPRSTDGWRGLFLAYARDGQNQKALATSARFPAAVKAALTKDPEYLRTLATIYHAENRNADAERVLAQALALPFPSNGANLKADAKLQYAGILMEAKRYEQAAGIYAQILSDDPGNLSAWMGIVSAHHEIGQDNQAIADVQKMPPASYEAALSDPGFLSMLGSMYQQSNQFEVAQGLLERSAKIQIAAGGQPSISLQLQLAAIYLQRNNTTQAYAIYRQLLATNPERADAWKGLIATLQATNRDGEALKQIAAIPLSVRKELEADIEFVQTEASLYAANGDFPRAVQLMNRVQAHYATLKTQPPASTEIQNAWLLFNTKNDRGLYPELMRLGGRKDLTVAQRETIEQIWANWSVRRAGTAMDNGDNQRAGEILDAASQAFPANLSVRKAVAGGYVRVGRAKEALALYKTIPMQDATAGDFQGAVGAALAANDKVQAEAWLRQALDRYPRDSAILSLAARFEQARGDNQRAADYWRAALAAMPQSSPTDKLAHELVFPEQDTRAHRAVTAADLQRLLDPSDEPFAKTTKVPPLPAYGADPYTGSAPVILSPRQPGPQSSSQALPWLSTPPSENQSPSVPISDSSVTDIPNPQPARTQLDSPQDRAQNSDELLVPGKPANSKSGRKKPSGQTHFAGNIPLPSGNESINSQQATSSSGPAESNGSIAGDPAQGMRAEIPAESDSPSLVPLTANPRHSQASDAWKGLVLSLAANNRNADALREMARIPPDIRRLLESDIAFVQSEASMYAAVGDTDRAANCVGRLETFYLVHQAGVPAATEVQYAWLLYNTKDERRLYAQLQHLDGRRDLAAAQRDQVKDLWASWAVRRASEALSHGDLTRGVEILEGASEEFPNDMGVRRAVAGAYAQVGRPAEAVSLFKTIPMQDASSGDFQGAIGAALAAKDSTQAEAWLRQALVRFPNDPKILGLAARFEESRGNGQRASDFWRAAVAAAPAGSTTQGLQNDPAGSGRQTDTQSVPATGNLKHLLDPRNDPPQKAAPLPPLPSYPQSSQLVPGIGLEPSTTPPRQSQSNDATPPLPLPLPNSAADSNGVPLYIPHNPPPEKSPAQPALVEQSATQDGTIQPAATARKPQPHPSHAPKKTKNSSTESNYAGKMNLPASEVEINSTEIGSQQASPAPKLRITSESLDNAAAQAQLLFAEQTDGQLTDGLSANIHALPNAPVGASGRLGTIPSGTGSYATAQYTPSAQEAATGAYSAPKQQTSQGASQQQQHSAPPASPTPAITPEKKGKRQKTARKHAGQAATPTLEQAAPAAESPGQNPDQSPAPSDNPTAPSQTTAPSTSGTGLSDEELEQRNLPPLRGPWVRVQREARSTSPRDEAELQLRTIESGYSPWLGGAGLLNYRSGNLGYDHLSALEAPFEASMALGYNARLTVVAKPVFLDSGQADGTAVITLQESTTAGSTLVTVPEPIGTLTTTNTTPPAQQNAVGIGGEVQLAFPHLAIAGGYTPAGFLVSTFTARGQWKPGNGPFTFSFVRDPVRDTQLSYAGLRDPSGNSLGTLGQIWGAVVANQGNAQFARGDAESGYYIGGGGQYLSGYQVETNTRVEGSGGAYWRLKTTPEYGNLSIGANFFGMHYAHNEDAFTHGMGGYFSPQAYFLANVPFTWVGHYKTRWHYNILGSLGVQAFQQDLTPLWPLAGDKALETSQNNAMLPAKTSVGPNYDFRTQVAYQISPHWFAGGYLSANNSRNYESVTTGFYIRFLFREQPSTVNGPTGIFPTDGLRPFTVP